MAELTQTMGGGVSFPNGVATQGRNPRIPNDGAGTGMEDSPYASIEVSIPAASVLTLRATPFTLVAAPGTGKVLQFISAYLELVFNSVAYTESTANLAVKYNNGSGAQVSETIEMTGFIDQTASTNTNARQKLDTIVAAASATNLPLVLHNLGAAEFGNSGDSVLKVKVIYCVHASS